MLVPIQFTIWDADHYQFTSNAGRVTKISDYSFSIDTFRGSNKKQDYCASFTNYIHDFQLAASAIGSKYVAHWRRET
jgi:hypothetical protein